MCRSTQTLTHIQTSKGTLSQQIIVSFLKSAHSDVPKHFVDGVSLNDWHLQTVSLSLALSLLPTFSVTVALYKTSFIPIYIRE